MGRGVQSITGVVAGHVQLGLAHLEDIDLHHAVRSGEEDGCRLDRLGAIGRAQDFKVRYLAAQSVDHIEVNCGAIRVR